MTMKNPLLGILILGFFVATQFSCTAKKAATPTKSTSSAATATGGCVADPSALGSGKLNLFNPADLEVSNDPQIVNLSGESNKVILKFEDKGTTNLDGSTEAENIPNSIAFKLCDIAGSYCACDELGRSCTMSGVGQDLTFGPNKTKDHMGLGDFSFVSDIILPPELIGKDLQLSYAPCAIGLQSDPTTQPNCGAIVKETGGIKVEGTPGAPVVKAPTANICNTINSIKNPTQTDMEVAIHCLQDIQRNSADFLYSAATTYVKSTEDKTIPDSVKTLRDLAVKLGGIDKKELAALFSSPDVFDTYNDKWNASAQQTVTPTGASLALADNPATSGCAGVLNNYAQAKTDAIASAPPATPAPTPPADTSADPLAGGPTVSTDAAATTPSTTSTSSSASKNAKNANNFDQALALVDTQISELTEAVRKYNTQETLTQQDLEAIQSGDLQTKKTDIETAIANLEDLVKKLFDDEKIKAPERDADEKKISFKQDQLVKLGGKIDLLAEGPKFRTLEEALKSFSEGDKTSASKTTDPTVSKSLAELEREIKTWEAKTKDDLKGQKVALEKLESKRSNLADRLNEIANRYPADQVADAQADFDTYRKKLENADANKPGFKERIAALIDRVPYEREVKGKASKAFGGLSAWWQDSNDEVRAAFVVPFVLVGVLGTYIVGHAIVEGAKEMKAFRQTYSTKLVEALGTHAGLTGLNEKDLRYARDVKVVEINGTKSVELSGKKFPGGKKVILITDTDALLKKSTDIEKELKAVMDQRAAAKPKGALGKIWEKITPRNAAIATAVIGTAVLAAFMLPNVINLTDAPCGTDDVMCFSEKFKQAFNQSYQSLVNSRYNIEVWRARQDILAAQTAATRTPATPIPATTGH